MNYSKQFLDNLFNRFEGEGISFCVLHSYETLPEHACSDIDVAIDPLGRTKLDALLSQTVIGTGFSIVQKIYYDVPYCYYYVLSKTTSEGPVIVKLDFLMDDKGINKYYLKSMEFLEGRIRYKTFYIPSHGMEAVYLLIKEVIKGKFLGEHFYKLRELYNRNTDEVTEAINRHINSGLVAEVIKALTADDMGKLTSLAPNLRQSIEARYKPNQLIEMGWAVKRIVKRFLYPTGVFVAVVSPDGGGKSSISKAMLIRLLGCFRKTGCLHWRPGLLPQIRTLLGKSNVDNEFQAANPHGSKRRSPVISFLRWAYYMADYIAGYYLKILPMKIRTTAVVMDRYYYDVVIDPIRYGFNLPAKLLKSISPFIPKPDLTIYLDNSPEDLYRRKHELPLSELRRQVEAWRELIPILPNPRILTTDKPLDAVVHEVTRLVLDRRLEMTRETLKIDPNEAKFLWKSGITDYIALPSKKNCRWIMPTSRKAFRRSWALYQPYSLKGKIYKNIWKSLFSLNSFAGKKIITEGSLNSEASLNLKTVLKEVLKRDDILMAISTGTLSPFRKITGLVMTSDGYPLAIVKIAETKQAIKRVMHEADMLKTLARKEFKDIRFPNFYFAGKIDEAYVLVQSFAPFDGMQGCPEMNERYINILRHLTKKTATKISFGTSSFYGAIKTGIDRYSLSYKELLVAAFEKVEGDIGGRDLIAGLSHGDFTPWNILWNGKETFLYDWESATFDAPLGIDLVHFSFQTGFLLKKLRANKLLDHVNNILASQEVIDMLKGSIAPDLLFLSYLLHMAVHEDREDLLNISSVERRRLLSLLSNKCLSLN